MGRVVYVIAGHSKKQPGASANGYDEAKLNIELRGLIVNALKAEANGVVQFKIDDDSDDLKTVISKINAQGTFNDVLIDIHFNAAGNVKAKGFEVFVADTATPAVKKAGAELSKACAELLGTTDRGCKTESQSNRGRLGMLRTNIKKAFLIEVAFLTNKDEMSTYIEKKEELAELIAEHLTLV